MENLWLTYYNRDNNKDILRMRHANKAFEITYNMNKISISVTPEDKWRVNQRDYTNEKGNQAFKNRITELKQ